jgi:hypothetical protein
MRGTAARTATVGLPIAALLLAAPPDPIQQVSDGCTCPRGLEGVGLPEQRGTQLLRLTQRAAGAVHVTTGVLGDRAEVLGAAALILAQSPLALAERVRS